MSPQSDPAASAVGRSAAGLARSVHVLGLAEAVGLASGLAMHVVVARRLSPAAYGGFAALLAVEVAMVALVSGGVPQALRFLVSVDEGNLAESLRWVAKVQVPLGAGVAALLALLGAPLEALVGSRGLAAALGVVALDVAVQCGLMEPFLALLNGTRRHGSQAVVAAVYFVGRLGFVAGSVALAGTLVAAAWGLVAASALASAVGGVLVLAARRRSTDRASAGFASRVAAWVRLGPGFEALAFLLVASHLWVVKGVVADPDLSGRYAACLMMAQAVSALGRTLAGATFAPLASAFARGETDRAREAVLRGARLLALALVPAWVFATARGGAVIGLLYGPRFQGSGPLLGVLVAGAGGVASLTFFGGAMGAAGRLRARLGLLAVLVPAGAAATAAAARLDGPRGASYALAATGALGAAWAARFVAGLVGPVVPRASLARAVIAAALVALLLPWGSAGAGAVSTARDLALAGSVYAGGLLALGEFGRRWPRFGPALGPGLSAAVRARDH